MHAAGLVRQPQAGDHAAARWTATTRTSECYRMLSPDAMLPYPSYVPAPPQGSPAAVAQLFAALHFHCAAYPYPAAVLPARHFYPLLLRERCILFDGSLLDGRAKHKGLLQ